MTRRAKNPNYVTFGPVETVVTFAKDRGELRTNDAGEFFLRTFTDGRFACASPDLERQLIDAGVRAGVPMGITRAKYGQAVIWKVRRIGEMVTMPERNGSRHRPKATPRDAFPPEKYATPEPPSPVFPEVDEPAPARSGDERNAALASAEIPVVQTADRKLITAPDSLLARCLCEAVDAVQAAQKYATEHGYAVAFGAPEVERIGVSIFIERTRNGAVYERAHA